MKTVKKRMKEFKKDLSRWREYDHIVINDDLNLCYKNIMKLIKNNKSLTVDKNVIYEHVKKLLA